MSYEIKTKSHGKIDGGFCSIYTNGFRFGELAFLTKSLHYALRHLANRPEAKAVNIPNFGVEAFWESFTKCIDEITGRYFTEAGFIPRRTKKELERLLAEGQGKIQVENLPGVIMIPIRVSDSEDEVAVGQYKITAPNFRDIAAYVVRGGFLGWPRGEYPESARLARESIMASRRPLYKGVAI